MPFHVTLVTDPNADSVYLSAHDTSCVGNDHKPGGIDPWLSMMTACLCKDRSLRNAESENGGYLRGQSRGSINGPGPNADWTPTGVTP